MGKGLGLGLGLGMGMVVVNINWLEVAGWTWGREYRGPILDGKGDSLIPLGSRFLSISTDEEKDVLQERA